MVKAGDLLAQIDPRPFQAALDQAKAKQSQDEANLANAKLDQQRYATLAKQSYVTQQQLDTQNALVAQLTAQIAMQASQLAGLLQERTQHVADREAQRQTAAKVEQTLPMVAERADIRRRASEIGYASVIARLESQQLLVETRAELDITQSKITSLDAAIAGLDDFELIAFIAVIDPALESE